MKQKLPLEDHGLKRSLSLAIVGIFAAIISYILVAFVITKVYHPDIESAIAYSKSVLIGGGHPEPLESLLFQAGIVFIPVFLLFFFAFAKMKLSKIQWEKYFNILSIIFLLISALIIYVSFNAKNPNFNPEATNLANSHDAISETNLSFYFIQSILTQNIFSYILLAMPLFFGFFYISKRLNKFFNSKSGRYIGLVFVFIYAAIYLFQIYQIFHFPFPYTWENKYDFNVIFYPMTQVHAGSPMLVDGFSANYGLYSHFLNPIFNFVELNVSNFTMIMSILIVLTFVFMLISMVKIIKSKLLVILGFSSLIYLTLILSRILTPFDAYFAVFPVRELFPALTLLLAAFYLQSKGKKTILYFCTFILLSFGILWNPEFGLISIISWIITLCYIEFFNNSDWKKICFACLKHIAIGLASMAVCFTLYALIINLKYGTFPNLINLFDSIIYFGELGANMLPMTLIHPWNLVILIYVIGLVYAIYALFNKSYFNYKSAFILLVSVMGIGLFMYFQGRSHNWNLLSICGNAIILLTIFADILLEKVNFKKNTLIYSSAFILILFLLGFSSIDLIRHQEKLTKLKKQTTEKLENFEEQKQIEENIAFVKTQIPETTEEIYIHTSNKYQALYFAPTKKRSHFNPSIIDIFTFENCNRLKNKILVDSSDIFIEPTAFYYPYVQPANAAMGATYSIKKSNGHIAHLSKRTYETLAKPILTGESAPLFYEKFSDDTSSLNQRIDYAVNGSVPIEHGDQFSIELVFFNEPQAYSGGTLLSNRDENKGFWLLNNGQPEQYLLSWGNNMGLTIPVSQYRWHYLVIQVNKGNLSVFIDGQYLYGYQIQAFSLSDKPLYIANHNANNLHFTGAISEVLIKNGLSSSEQIKQRQKALEAQL